MRRSSSLINNLGFSPQKMYYWRQAGLIGRPQKTRGGHYQYSFHDLKSLKTIKILQRAGISTYKIRKCYESLKKLFPSIEHPFCGRPIYVANKKMVFAYEGYGYDPFSGQAYLLDFQKLNGLGEGDILGLGCFKEERAYEGHDMVFQLGAEK